VPVGRAETGGPESSWVAILANFVPSPVFL